MQQISVLELYQQLNSREEIQLIDVREQWEHELFNIGGEIFPLGSLMANADKVSRDKTVVFYCQKGIRSQIAIQRLEQKLNATNLVNLTGGMDAWKRSGYPANEKTH